MEDLDLAEFDTFSTPEQQTAPIEEAAVVPIEEPVAPAEQTDPMLADFDTFSTPQQLDAPQVQADPRLAQVEQHRPPEVDDNTWADIKGRVSKFLGEYTPIMAIPEMATQLMGEAQQREGSQVQEAISVKSRLENIDFAYSDLADTFKSAVGNKESEQLLKTKQNSLNNEVVTILSDRGIEAYNDEGKLKVVVKDEDGNEVVKNLDDETLDNVLGGFKAGAGEMAAATIGAIGGAAQAQKLVPKTAGLPVRGTAALIGGGIGGYTGAAVGRATDLIRNAVSLNKEIDAKEVLTKSLEAGTADVAGAAAIGVVAKGVSKAVAPIGKALDRVKTLMKQGDIQGAKRVVKEDYGLTDANIDTMFESVAKDVEGLKDLTGDDLLRAKLTAVIQQQPQGKALITSAIRNNAKAAIQTSKEIDMRAKQVLDSADKFSKKPSAIKKSVEAYEKAVGKNYGQVRGLIDEALPNYKSDLKLTDFTETLQDVNTRVIDPTVKEKLTNLSDSLSKQKSESIGDLIDTRQLFNKFYGKNQSHFESKIDKDSLMSIQKTIDTKIDEAIDSIGNEEVSSGLKNAFKDAKGKYAQMFKTQDTATYNAIFKKGASEEEIGKSLVKYSKSADADLENVLGKLSPVQRTKSEFSIIKQMVDTATAKGEAKAVDFVGLLEDMKTSKAIFKTPEAKQFLKNIENYDKKFGKDIDIQKIASGVAPKVEKNIATGLMGKIWMKISSLRFEAMQRMIPSETGRRLSLQKSIESALEKSRTPREFFFNASKIKGMPNKDRIALKSAVKEIGEKESILKEKIAKQDLANEANIQKALDLKASKVKEDLLKKKALTKTEWENAKAKAKKQKLSEQAAKAKEAMEVPQGGSEAEANQAVKNVFAKNKSQEAKFKSMSKEDIAEMERLDRIEGETMFAKGAPELLGGTVAGVEQDEQGNITIDPRKFLMGALGVASIKGLAKQYKKSPKAQAKVEKALKSLASDSTRVAGDMLEKINKQVGLNIEPKIVANVKSKIKDEKDLIVQHNLTEGNILHSKKVGGLAVPSLAVTKKDTPLTGFGEITLLGNSDLIKPTRETRVFGADVYSPRYPQVNYSMTAKQQRMIDEDLAPYEAVTASQEYTEKDSLNALYDNTAFRAKFLDEKGIKVKLPKTKRADKEEMDSYNKYYKNLVPLKNYVDSQTLRFDKDMQKALLNEYEEKFSSERYKDLVEELGEPLGLDASKQMKNSVYRRAQEISRLAELNKNAGKPDEYEIKKVIRELVNKKKLGAELKSYASKYLQDAGAKETIWNGTDRMGRNKYTEHTLSNVISKLSKDLRGGESFNYGLGTTRAKLTPEFRTIESIKRNKDKLVSSEQFEIVKKEMNEQVDEIAENLKSYYEYDSNSFGYTEEVLHAIGDQDFKGYGFKNIPSYLKEDINQLITAIKEMPTEYFEAKVLKALDIGEFKIAVIPNGTSKETIQLLKDKGLKVSKYNPLIEKSREETIKKVAKSQKVLFMHPATIGGSIVVGSMAAQEKENN